MSNSIPIFNYAYAQRSTVAKGRDCGAASVSTVNAVDAVQTAR